MTSSRTSARAADLNSMASDHRFPWKWWMKDLPKIKKNGMKVFSCFSCGGGSSMGYKLAGYEVIGNVEIDPRVMEVYRKNNHPKHPYLMDVRDFLKIPDELMRFGEKKRQYVLSSEALDRFVQEIKEEQASILLKHPKLPATDIALEKRVSMKTGIPCACVHIGYHLIYLESIQGEE